MDRDPISPGGWQVWRHTYKGKPAKLLQTAMSLDWCRQYLINWKAHSLGTAELYISPVSGWKSIEADAFGAIAWAIAEGLMSIEIGAATIRAIAEEVADRHPAEGLLGLAIFYLRAMDDNEVEPVIDGLSDKLRKMVGDVDDPMPF